jgi:DNA-directed RNA polymerase subunit RPC12/RpoP
MAIGPWGRRPGKDDDAPGGGVAVPAGAEELRFPCAQCGANLRYTPGETWMSCSYCGHEQPIPGAGAERVATVLVPMDLRATLAAPPPAAAMEETRVLSCTNCGAQVQFEPAVHAAECPFCGTPVVTDTGTHRHIKPQGVLPFRLTDTEARAAFAKWLKGLWFAPNGLARYARGENRFAGIYVPYWAFDADTRSQFRGERGIYYTTGSGKQRRREIRWSPASGTVARRFDDLLVMAAQSLPRRYVTALEPWRLDDLQPYDARFLSGFRAEGYTVDLPEGWQIGRARMDEVIRGDVARAIGGDVQRIHSVQTATSSERFKHLLLPVWVAAYRYRGRSFRFVVNAQTGQVRGERPWSWIKIAFAVLLAGLALAGFAALSEMQ